MPDRQRRERNVETFDHLKRLVRDVPGFPLPEVVFRDITPLLGDAAAFGTTIDALAARYRRVGVEQVVGIESRGFIVGAPLALALEAGFVPIRKLGKLPRATFSREYTLEYGTNHLEIHRDAIVPGQRVLLVDDVLATGGTARASAELIWELGGELVGAAFLIELPALNGRTALGDVEIFSLLSY